MRHVALQTPLRPLHGAVLVKCRPAGVQLSGAGWGHGLCLVTRLQEVLRHGIKSLRRRVRNRRGEGPGVRKTSGPRPVLMLLLGRWA